MKRNKMILTNLFVTGGTAFVLFIIVMIGVIRKSHWIKVMDTVAFQFMHDNITKPKTIFLALYSELGSAKFVAVYTVIIVSFLCLFRKVLIGLWFGASVLFFAIIIENILKHVIARPRPDQAVWLIKETGFSFPSGHAVAATVFFGLTSIILMITITDTYLRAMSGFIAFVIILGIMSTRVYLGVHNPSDVLGGFLYGTASSCLSIGVYLLVREPLQRRLRKWHIKDQTKVF